MATLLPKKTNQIPVATDDEHHEAMAKDPTIKEIPKDSGWNSLYTQAAPAPAPSPAPAPTPAPAPAPAVEQFQPQIMTGASPVNAASGADVLVENTNTDWINKKWRPAMGWMYMVVCVTDFVLFPILWSVVQFWETNAANDAFRQWQPLTLQGAGLFHIAMGAVLGIAAYGRTREKVEGKA